jgi:hypothetical protein
MLIFGGWTTIRYISKCSFYRLQIWYKEINFSKLICLIYMYLTDLKIKTGVKHTSVGHNECNWFFHLCTLLPPYHCRFESGQGFEFSLYKFIWVWFCWKLYAYWIHFWNQPILSNEYYVFCLRKQWLPGFLNSFTWKSYTASFWSICVSTRMPVCVEINAWSGTLGLPTPEKLKKLSYDLYSVWMK